MCSLWTKGIVYIKVFAENENEEVSVMSLAHQWILCSEWVPCELESKQLINTSQWSTWHNKQIHQVIILFSSMEKLLPSESGEKYAHLQVKTVQNTYFLCGFWCERTGSIIMDYGLWPETMV